MYTLTEKHIQNYLAIVARPAAGSRRKVLVTRSRNLEILFARGGARRKSAQALTHIPRGAYKKQIYLSINYVFVSCVGIFLCVCMYMDLYTDNPFFVCTCTHTRVHMHARTHVSQCTTTSVYTWYDSLLRQRVRASKCGCELVCVRFAHHSLHYLVNTLRRHVSIIAQTMGTSIILARWHLGCASRCQQRCHEQQMPESCHFTSFWILVSWHREHILKVWETLLEQEKVEDTK